MRKAPRCIGLMECSRLDLDSDSRLLRRRVLGSLQNSWISFLMDSKGLDYHKGERYQNVPNVVPRSRAGAPSIPVREITVPNLGIVTNLDRKQNFSLFLPSHRQMAGRLIEIFLGMRDYEDFLSASVYCHDRVNPQMYIYCLTVAILHRPDTRNLPIPSLAEVFPDKFITSRIFADAREEANLVPAGSRIPIEIPRDYTASNLDNEHKLAYFREDLGINLHHWHWHLVYPATGPMQVVNKDRRGELLFYMHSQIMSRYNFERLCNDLKRVERWSNWREPIREGYFPKLDTVLSSRAWASRPANSVISDVNRPVDQVQFDIQDLERWRDRIYEAIQTQTIQNDRGQRVRLTEKDGIDVLGNLMEASSLSPNLNLYGDLHNFMHLVISYVHDPDHRYLESFSPIGDPAVTMRDPVFYRLHSWVEYVFQLYKQTLPPYPVEQLNYPGVDVTDVEVVAENQPKNTLHTFWQQSDVDMSRGLDFTPRGAVLARFTHLQYTPYTYRVQVHNKTNSNKLGTCRIFIAPKHDDRGLPMLFADQKTLMVELDKFTVTLKPGRNTLERSSALSAVTIPFEQTFRNLDVNRPTTIEEQDAFNFCGCGWPQHMLLPRGKINGFPSELFVMISNYDGDKIDQTLEGQCMNAASYCGIRNKKYPDARAMGYPFDRYPRNSVNNLSQFLTPNMKVRDVTILHTNSILRRPTPSTASPTATMS
ncbi:phenoloxidase 1-like isoform X1 [Athalia rosae]|uniref:phenoloxidase 1-like isoform X1 n=1 Tax=Athalia rosae TaxID=37344 RepID=UPI002034431E|nr:phenoloxidase 1-like isoform X1 [Athalia rosae]